MTLAPLVVLLVGLASVVGEAPGSGDGVALRGSVVASSAGTQEPKAQAGTSVASPPQAMVQAARAIAIAKAMQVGDASGRQLAEILGAARRCFGAHPVDTSNLGNLQGTLGSAVGCVQRDLKKVWGHKPAIPNYGSQSCGQCGYGLGSTVIEVDTEAGKWMFVVQLEGMQGAVEASNTGIAEPRPQAKTSVARPPQAMVQVARATATAKALQAGDASGRQLAEILGAARRCFGAHPVDTSNLGNLQGTLGSAVGCVQRDLTKVWGHKPAIPNYGSQSCGQCEGYGLGSTVIEVDTEAGKWMLVVQLEGATSPAKPPATRGHAVALQKGDATDAQLAEILRATTRCFHAHQVETSNLGQLQGTLRSAVGCVQKACEQTWGWKPRVSGQGSHSCGQCDGYGLGATIIAMDGTPSGDWMFEMRLK